MDLSASAEAFDLAGERPRVRSPEEARSHLSAEEWGAIDIDNWSQVVKTSFGAPFIYAIGLLILPWLSGDLVDHWEVFVPIAVLTEIVCLLRIYQSLHFEQLYHQNFRRLELGYHWGQNLALLGVQLSGGALIWYNGSNWPGLVFAVWIMGLAGGAGLTLMAFPKMALRVVKIFVAPPLVGLVLWAGFPGKVVALIAGIQLVFILGMCKRYSEDYWSGKTADALIRRYAAKVVQSNEALRCAQQVHAQFLSRMSHELRTPLNGIQGCAELLGDDPMIREREELGLIVQSAERLRRLYDHLFLVVDIDAGKLPTEVERIDLATLQRDCEITLHDDIARCGLQIAWKCHSEGPIVAQSRVLRFVLDELIYNICTHSGAQHAEVSIGVQEGLLQLEVSDDGGGIPEEYRLQLFRRFENGLMVSSKHGEGAGLGLALCRELAESLGGGLRLKDDQEVGTAFVFELPVQNAASNGRRAQVKRRRMAA